MESIGSPSHRASKRNTQSRTPWSTQSIAGSLGVQNLTVSTSESWELLLTGWPPGSRLASPERAACFVPGESRSKSFADQAGHKAGDTEPDSSVTAGASHRNRSRQHDPSWCFICIVLFISEDGGRPCYLGDTIRPASSGLAPSAATAPADRWWLGLRASSPNIRRMFATAGDRISQCSDWADYKHAARDGKARLEPPACATSPRRSPAAIEVEMEGGALKYEGRKPK